MNKRILLLVLTSVASNVVRRNFFLYSSLGPHSEAWVGSSAFSAAITLLLVSYATISQPDSNIPLAILYTYYTAVSLLVSILVLKLIWIPVVDLIMEINLILSKTMLYINKILYPSIGNTIMKDIGIFLGSKTAVIWATNLFGIFILYSVSADVLNYMALYFYTLPKNGMFARMRTVAIKGINAMLNALNTKKQVRFQWNSEVKYFSPNTSQEDVFYNYEVDEGF